MSNYYLDLPVIGEVPEAYLVNSADLMSSTGINIGNLAFRHALRFILTDLDSFLPVRYLAYAQAANRGAVQRTLVSCANWLGTSDRDEASNLHRAQAIEASDAPTVCFGLGVQARAGDQRVDLGPNTRRLAKSLADRAKLVSVRDELTRRTLEEIGISNVVVTGCPSNFINSDPTLGHKIMLAAEQLRSQAPTWSQLRSMISEFSGGHPASGLVLRESLRLMAETPAFLVVQTPILMPLLLRESQDIPHPYLKNNPFGQDKHRLTQILKSSTLHFSSVAAWLDFSRTCDLSFGMRIHGTMIPLQAGVPSILVSHDTRTAGLAAQMGIPRLPAEEFAELCRPGPKRMLEMIIEQMEDYDKRRQTLARTMLDFLSENQMDAHPSLLRLAG